MAMNILALEFRSDPAAHARCVQFYSEMVKQGHKVWLLAGSPFQGSDWPSQQEGIRVIPVTSIGWLPLRKAAFAFVALWARSRFNVVHIHARRSYSLAPFLRLLRKEVLVSDPIARNIGQDSPVFWRQQASRQSMIYLDALMTRIEKKQKDFEVQPYIAVPR